MQLEAVGSLPELAHRVYPLSGSGGPAARRAELLFLETVYPQFTLECLDLIRRSIVSEGAGEVEKGLQRLATSSPQFLGTRTNNRHFIKSAKALDLPVMLAPGGLFLIGWGSRSRLLSSSSTEVTAAASLDLSRDKAASRRFLMACDLPVAEQRTVATVAEAVRAANEIGYPVVVKPRSRDGGIGVTTNLNDDGSVRAAFNRARAEDTSVLVERFVRGREFRLLFANDRLISVHERVPAHVFGNGRDRIVDLVEQENIRRLAAPQTGFTNIPISLDEDSDRCLAAVGLTRKSIPGLGDFVRLSTVPKVRSGGEARLIDRAAVHRDVVAAAAKAVGMMRLDIAGVDYIAPDCTRSWRESGGIITEVNAIPQINRFEGFDVHAAVLQAAMPGVGPVPAVLLADAGPALLEPVRRLAAHALAIGLKLGLVADDPAVAAELAGDVAVTASHGSLFSVLGDRRVNAILVLQDVESLTSKGLMLDRLDACVLPRSADGERASLLGHPFVRPHFADRIILPQDSVATAALRKSFGEAALLAYRDETEMTDLILSLFGPADRTSVQRADGRQAFAKLGGRGRGWAASGG